MHRQTDRQADRSDFIGPSTLQKLLNHKTIQVTIYQETTELTQIINFQECIFNTDKHWPHFINFLQGQRIILRLAVGHEKKFHLLCCIVEISCAIGSTNDVLKHHQTPKHFERRKSIKGKNLILFFIFTAQIPCRLESNKHLIHEILTSFQTSSLPFSDLK